MMRRPTDESGFTLVEVLVAMLMMMLVLFALYSLFDTGIRIFKVGNDKLEATANARAGLNRIEREIRAAYPYGNPAHVVSGSETSVTFGNDLNGDFQIDTSVLTSEEITYSLVSISDSSLFCSQTTSPCRLVRKIGSSGYQPVVSNLVYSASDASRSKIEYLKRDGTITTADSAQAVRITLVVREGDSTQRLSTDVTLRNAK